MTSTIAEQAGKYYLTLQGLAVEARVRCAAREIADSIIDSARTSGDDPIAWITGNSYMPSLRSFSAAEEIYQREDTVLPSTIFTPWEMLVEHLAAYLLDAHVCLEEPEYDNALYAVDLRRFRYEESETGETLQSDWQQVITPDTHPDRFTEREAEIFRHFKCAWMISYGVVTPEAEPGNVGYCLADSEPGADYGFCIEHSAEYAADVAARKMSRG